MDMERWELNSAVMQLWGEKYSLKRKQRSALCFQWANDSIWGCSRSSLPELADWNSFWRWRLNSASLRGSSKPSKCTPHRWPKMKLKIKMSPSLLNTESLKLFILPGKTNSELLKS